MPGTPVSIRCGGGRKQQQQQLGVAAQTGLEARRRRDRGKKASDESFQLS